VARLIVNADDFGLTSGVNRAIAELHAAGVLTSTSLMARAQASDEAIEIARSIPTLGVGCHVVLVDGEPTLPPLQIPSLIDSRTGTLYTTLTAFLPRLFTGRIRLAEIEAETRAQIEFLQSKGLQLTHIDTHKHTHMFPIVLRHVLRAARACGIRAVRSPFEPSWALRATIGAPWMRLAQVSALRWLDPVCRRIIAEEGFSTTDGIIAVAGTGTIDAVSVRCLLKKLPAGTWELVAHPGFNDADLARVRTRLRASRDIERQALAVLKEFPAIRLISFADLTSH
jgi:hopanoid biosynthesis associated protein HpnK